MVDSTRKRARVEEEEEEEEFSSSDGGGGGGDRISGLCNGILHHIFSFLPTTREVVQTCVLSKRWRNLWCSVPWLDFDEEAFLASSSSSSSNSSFSTFVNYAMLLRDGSSNIQKLRLSCSSDSNRVFQYIVAALKHNLQVLDLQILHHHQAAAENVLPCSLFTCQSLTFLKLNNVVLPSSSSNIYLSSLKTLHLISVKFPLSTECLFSNSPTLETLTLHNCNFEHPEYFNISILKLKNLIIIHDEVPSSTSSITQLLFTSAPNLTSLKLHVEMQSRWYFFKNLNSLEEANIHLNGVLHLTKSFMIGIFRQLQNVKAITLSGSCLQLIGELDIYSSSVETSFHNLKLMKLTTCFEKYEVRGITHLLNQSPNIETLVIEYNSESSSPKKKLPVGEKKPPSKCTLHHLKTIQMRGFGGRKNEIKLLTFLLENAKSLKKMIVEEEASI